MLIEQALAIKATMIPTTQIALYALIPCIASLVGGAIGSTCQIGRSVISALQHFVAGVVVAAASTELLPRILGDDKHWSMVIGFVLGVVAMLLIEEAANSLMKKRSIGLVIGSLIDLFANGLLIALAFIAGLRSGLLIAASLSFCAFFLSLTVMIALKERGIPRLFPLLLLAAMLPFGAFIGGHIVMRLPPMIFLETISFGVAALLYLGIQGLLGEAHKQRESVWVSASFFLGFILIYLIQ